MKNIETLKFISENSRYVFINKARIRSFVNNIDSWEYHYWINKKEFGMSEEEFIIFAFLCESMNFCFWENRKWRVLYGNKEYVGSEALFYTILREVSSNKFFLNVEYLKKIKYSQFRNILMSNGELPALVFKRFKLFKETIKIIAKKKEYFFQELFALESDEELLKYIVKNFKHFDDKSRFKGRTIHFNKRAILLANDLFRMSETIRTNLKTINNLTGGADYAIPKVLYEQGILTYDNKLSKIIQNKKIIKHNSQMEVEIRANTLYVLEIMKDILKSKNIHLTSIELDNIIWNMRKNTDSQFPPHHTKTIYY